MAANLDDGKEAHQHGRAGLGDHPCDVPLRLSTCPCPLPARGDHLTESADVPRGHRLDDVLLVTASTPWKFVENSRLKSILAPLLPVPSLSHIG